MKLGRLCSARYLLLSVLAVGLTACATTGGGATASGGTSPTVDVDGAVAALQAAQGLYGAGEYASATAAADSLYSEWRDVQSLASLAERSLLLAAQANEAGGLLGPAGDRYFELLARDPDVSVRQNAVGRYADILARTGRADEAAALALANAGLLDEDGLVELRQWVGGLTVDQLSRIRESHGPGSREGQIVYVQLAELLAADGNLGAARRVARQVLAAGASEPERGTAEVLAGLDDAGSMTSARLGAILPLTGELASVGTLLREGIDLAVEAYERSHPDGFSIEVVVRDDRSNPESTAGLVEDLEREGVIAIIGPLRSESFAAAARARRNARLPILSPTALEVFGSMPNAYTLYSRDQRELDVATDLAAWTVQELGLRRAAVLRPSDPALARAASIFGRAFAEAGGTVVATASYTTAGTTTFQEPIETLARAAPDVVFAPAATAPAVLTLAPQLVYYGLDRSISLGSEAWAEPAVLRRLEGFAADYRVVGLWADRVTAGTPWQSFVRTYERKYRKSLRDNMVPALAHDATHLVLEALHESRLPIPAAIATRLAAGFEREGLTGHLTTDPETSTVRRETKIRMLLSGALEEPERDRLLQWLADARAAEPREPVRSR